MSMSTTVYQYRIYCNEESQFVLTWDTTTPTLCPNDHANRSNIDSSKTIVDSVSKDNLQVNEPYNGYFKVESIIVNVPAMSPSGEYIHDMTWDYDIILWNADIMPVADMIDDQLNVIAGPETTVGTLTASASVNDTILTVTAGIVSNPAITRGVNVVIDDGVNKHDGGVITNIDVDNSQITIQTPLAYAYAIGTLVKVSVFVIEDMLINYSGQLVSIGKKGFQGKPIAAGTTLRVLYKNNNGLSKKLVIKLEMYNIG